MPRISRKCQRGHDSYDQTIYGSRRPPLPNGTPNPKPNPQTHGPHTEPTLTHTTQGSSFTGDRFPDNNGFPLRNVSMRLARPPFFVVLFSGLPPLPPLLSSSFILEAAAFHFHITQWPWQP